MEHVNRIISMLYRYGQRFFFGRLRGMGVDVGAMPAMLQACRFPGITQEAMTANTGMDKGTTARSVKQLEAQGFVRRETDLDDRRVQHVYPTQRALQLLPEVERVIEQLHTQLYRGFSQEEIGQAMYLLGRMKDNLIAYFKGP